MIVRFERVWKNQAMDALKDIFNCDESDRYFQKTPDRTPPPTAFSGRKLQNVRFIFLACYNVKETETLSLFYLSELYLRFAVLEHREDNNSVFTRLITSRPGSICPFFDCLCQLDRKIR